MSNDEHGPSEVYLLPSALFLHIRETTGVRLSDKEIANYVYERLDETSLIEPEHLCWGFQYEKKTGEIWIFYTSRGEVNRRIKAMGNDPKVVVPEFALLNRTEGFREQNEFTLNTSECLTSLKYEGDGKFPTFIESKYKTEEKASDTPIWDIQSIQFIPKSGVIEAVWKKGDEILTARVAQSEWLRMDLRDTELLTDLQAELANRKLSRIFYFLNGGLLAFLIVYQLFTWGTSYLASSRMQLWEEQEVRVKEIMAKEKVAKVLQGFQNGAFRPFDWLLFINECRPGNVSLSNVRIGMDQKIMFSGHADLAKEMNDFQNALNQGGNFKSVTSKDVRSQTNGVEFSVDLVLKKWTPVFVVKGGDQ
jgi:hypothetical protein